MHNPLKPVPGGPTKTQVAIFSVSTALVGHAMGEIFKKVYGKPRWWR